MKAATIKILFAVAVLLLCAGLLAGCSDPLTEPGLTGARSLMDQRSRTQILSEMTEKECVEFIVSKGVVIPDDFIDHPQLGAFVKSDIRAAELNPNIPPAYSWDVSYKFAESIRTVVNKYYGTSRSYSASTRSTHILQDSKVLTKNGNWGSSGGYWHYDWHDYNCYAYAIGRIEQPIADRMYLYQPGDFAKTGKFNASKPVYDLALIVKADLEKLTSSPVQITNIAPDTSTLQPQQKLICVRKGTWDYHFMKYHNDAWYHKPSGYAPMKYNYKTTDIEWGKTWTDEKSDGSEYEADYFYNSEIYYIIYNDWNPQTTVTADTIPLRAPVAGRPPQTRVVTHHYTGTVTWANSYGTPLGSNQTFAAGTAYTAVINLDAAVNFTIQGLPSNFFTVFGAASTSFNSAAGVLTVVFPPAKTAVGDFDVLFSGSSYTAPIGIITLYTDNTWTLEEAGFYSSYLNDIYMVFPNPNVEHCLSWNIPMSITGYLAQVDMTANVELAVRYPIGHRGGMEYLEYALVLEVSNDGAKIIWRDQTVNKLLSFDRDGRRYMPIITVPVSGVLIRADGGNGTEYAPYQISNVEQLLNIHILDSSTTYFTLINDIDLSVAYGGHLVRLPLPHFYGYFKGNGKTISNLSANYPLTVDGGLGLFEENSGTIENLNVTGRLGVSMEARVGMIAGKNHGTIRNCTSRSNVRRDMIFGIQGFSPDAQTGGIAGYNSGTVQYCTNYGGMISYNNVGGIVGYNEGQVIGSYNYGSIEGRNNIGGVAGVSIVYSIVSHSYNEGNVSGYEDNYGGIVGYNSGEVINSHNTGIVGGGNNIGGIAGYSTGIISHSYNTGQVCGGGDNYGGIVGQNIDGAIVKNTYNTGSVNGRNNIGGIVGQNMDSTVSYSYNTGNVYGNNYTGGITGLFSYTVNSCVSLGKEVSGTANVARVAGDVWFLSNNIARADMIVKASGISVQITSHPNGIHGESTPLNTPLSAVFRGWDTGVWDIPVRNLSVNGALPTLRGMPPQYPVLP